MPVGTEPRGAPQDVGAFWGYFGVGCLTFFAGSAGGAMTSVLIAKIVGALRGCAPEPETGAPCGWFMFAVIGGLIGAMVLPMAVILRLRAGRARTRNSDRG